MRIGSRPIYTQQGHSFVQQGPHVMVYSKLYDEEFEAPATAAPAPATAEEPIATVIQQGQHTLVWKEPLVDGDTKIEPGSLNLYKYPDAYGGKELVLLRSVLLGLAKTHCFHNTDACGACPIHALVVSNSESSLELAMDIFEKVPTLLLQTHASGPFTGEGVLHILCVNRREEEAIRVVELALAQLSEEDVRHVLRTQATGPFFAGPPMSKYGESPLSYACVFGLRALLEKMVATRMVSLDEEAGALSGFLPLHVAVANGLADMCDFLVDLGADLQGLHRARSPHCVRSLFSLWRVPHV